MYFLGKRSTDNLKGVHPDLVKVVQRAISITKQDFAVIEGLRSKERQEQLVKEGKSQTTNSRHLTGHAVDIVPWVDGKPSWDWKFYSEVRSAMIQAAGELGVEIEWGGNWKTFKDGPHWQLPWSKYPVAVKSSTPKAKK